MSTIRVSLVIATMAIAAFAAESRAQTASFADLSHPLATGWSTQLGGGFIPVVTITPTVNHDLAITLADASQVTFRAVAEASGLASIVDVRVSFFLLEGSPATHGTLSALRADLTPYSSTFSGHFAVFPSSNTTIYEDFDFTPFEPANYLYTNAGGMEFLLSGDGTGHFTVTAPIPEPETYAMMLAGLALLGFEARRRRKLQPAAA